MSDSASVTRRCRSACGATAPRSCLSTCRTTSAPRRGRWRSSASTSAWCGSWWSRRAGCWKRPGPGGYLVIHTAMINEAGQHSAAWNTFWGPPSVTLTGTWGAAHVDELAPKAGEPVVVKYAYGAFVGTNLDTMLRSRGIETLVIAGADLNICVGDTFHHAFALGYNIVAAADCLTCFSKRGRQHAEQMKDAGLYLVENHYGIVSRSEDIIAIISRKG